MIWYMIWYIYNMIYIYIYYDIYMIGYIYMIWYMMWYWIELNLLNKHDIHLRSIAYISRFNTLISIMHAHTG